MKTLIAEDDYTSRAVLQRLLTTYGKCTVAVNGKVADQVKIIMTTPLADLDTVRKTIRKKCGAYLIKPYNKQKLFDTLRFLGLLEDAPHESADC